MNFSTNTNNESKLCAKCNNTATKACSACRGAPNSEGTLAVTTWYCSAECQTTDRAAHKDICKAREARKILYRAGSTAQAAFAKYREEMFDKSLKAVNRKGKSIVLVDNYYKTEDIIFPFPSALFPDSGEKQAVLMFMTCNDAYFVMHNSIKMLLKGKSISREAVARSSRRIVLSDQEQGSTQSSKMLWSGLKTGPTT